MAFNGNLLGKPNATTTTAATGLWRTTEQHLSTLAGTWPPYTTSAALLHLDGNLNDVAGTTWSTTGSPAFSTSTYKFGTASMSLNSGPYIYTSSRYDMSALKPFTAECWFNPNRSDVSGAIMCTSVNSGTYPTFWLWQTSASLQWSVAGGSMTYWQHQPTVGSITFGQWYHVAVCGDGTTLRLFLNGTMISSTTHPSWTSTSVPLFIGGLPGGTGAYFNGYIDEVRLLLGTAAYTSNFTAPTGPFT